MIVRAARGTSEVGAALELRRRVFCDEQGVDLAAERDGRDGEALHVVAIEDDAVVGTCRILIDGDLARLGRMAVEPRARGGGLGAALLTEAEERARACGARRMRLHAQDAADSLYARAGYRAHGERFVEEGLPHVAMEKALA